MASNGLAVISGSGGSTIVHKLCADGTVVLGQDKEASVLISGSLCVTGSVKFSGSLLMTGSSFFSETITGSVSDISNHLVSGLSNVSSSTDAPATGSIFVYDGTNWVATGSVNPSNHALTHIASGSDVINGDRLDITFVPTVGYSRDPTVTQASSSIELAAHLAGIASALSAAAAGGEVNTASNIGSGEGVFAQKVLLDLEFKSLTTGSNIEISSSASEINIALADQISLTGVTASFLGNLIGNVTGDVTGDLTGDVTGNVLGNLVGDVSGNLTGNVLGDLVGNVTGQVSDISNHTTDDLAEGSTNLYFTIARARTAITASDTNSLDLEWDDSTGVLSGNVIVSPTGSIFISPSGLAISGTFTTAANTGSGAEVFAEKVGNELRFRTLVSSSNINISQSASEIDFALADQISLTGVTASFVGDLVGNVTGQVSDISNHTIGEMSNVSSSADSPSIGDFFVYDGTNWVPTGSSATGEDNTASNLGSGEGLFAQKVGVDLQFKSLTSGSNLVLSSSANEVNIALASQISVTGVTASFVGDLVGDVTGDLTGNVLGDLVGNVTGQVSDISNHTIGELSNVSSSADNATIGDVLYWDGSAWTTVTSASVGEGNTASNIGSGEGWFAQKVGVDLEFKSATTGSNLILSSSSNEINIAIRPQITLTAVTASFLGDLTGDVTGNVLGNVIGNLTGNVTGSLVGGDLSGTLPNPRVIAITSGSFTFPIGSFGEREVLHRSGSTILGVRKDYGNSASDPTDPAPSEGDTYYNTDLEMDMRYDGSRGKWLSVQGDRFTFGRRGNTGAGAFFRGAGNINFTAARGYPTSVSGTVIEAQFTRADTDAAVIQIVDAGTEIAFISSSAVLNEDDTLDADFGPNAILGVQNKSGGNAVNNVHGWVKVRWRA